MTAKNLVVSKFEYLTFTVPLRLDQAISAPTTCRGHYPPECLREALQRLADFLNCLKKETRSGSDFSTENRKNQSGNGECKAGLILRG